MPITYGRDARLAGNNTFSKALEIADVPFFVTVSGTFVGTLSLQVKPTARDVEHDWITEETYTAPINRVSRVLADTWEVRIGFAPGDYTSGTAHITIAG